MRLIFHGILRERFGRDAVMAANSVGEAIEGFSRQADWPADIVVRVVGFDAPEQFKDFAEEVHIMPALRGGGGKFGSILLGAAVIGVGLIAGGAWLIPLVVSGGLMIAQGVIGLFMKSPTIKGTDDPEASKYLPVNRNTTAIGTVIIMAWGRIDLAGHWLSLQSDSTNLSYGSFPASPS